MKSIFNMALIAGVAQSIKLSSDPIESSAGGPVKDTGLPFGDYFHAKMDEFPDEHLDDMFMNAMLSNYAKEGRNPDGTKNGKFYLDRDSGRRASQEVVQTHLKLTGKANEDYLVHNFDEAWDYYDVNRENLIEADRMSTFFRYLCHDANLNIQ